MWLRKDVLVEFLFLFFVWKGVPTERRLKAVLVHRLALFSLRLHQPPLVPITEGIDGRTQFDHNPYNDRGSPGTQGKVLVRDFPVGFLFLLSWTTSVHRVRSNL